MTKICSKCKNEKELSNFYKERSGRDGHRTQCKACDIEKGRKWNKVNNSKHKAHQKAWRENNHQSSRDQRNKYVVLNKEAVKDSLLKSIYGISLQEYKALAASQNNKCAICRKEVESYLFVDHCHVTGKIRGLLCRNCNSGIGLLGDTSEKVLTAVEYLRKFESSNV